MSRDQERIATGFIATGPNISSQELLFSQLAVHLKAKINGPVVILRSADALNLKAVLKQIIRDATSQKPGMDDDEEVSLLQDGRKLLNYDLEILHGFVRAHGSQAVVIAFQDSEAFDNSIVAELVVLFRYVVKDFSRHSLLTYLALGSTGYHSYFFLELLPRSIYSMRGFQEKQAAVCSGINLM